MTRRFSRDPTVSETLAQIALGAFVALAVGWVLLLVALVWSRLQ